ncbi:ImmA/IrrE family metallo-endopeptidase [Promicromonospora sp. Populi]|uniref:ImmA/IrrE family metallo-endopeptidase n=1 Tax=Promicromonospora sp. Populi TaxID=3239420 RepID=UPI0034E2CD65
MTMQRDYAVATGEFIAEWLEDNDMSAAELSRRLGVSRKHVSELLSGKVGLSHDSALGLESVTGVPARRWNQIEALYQEDRARLNAESVLRAQYERATKFPLAYLRKWGLITATAHDKAELVRQLSTFFGVADLDAWYSTWSSGAVAYRKVAVRSACPESLSTWLAIGEQRVEILELPPHNHEELRSAIPYLRALTREDPNTYISRARDILSRAGVAFVIVPPIPGLGVFGATRWIHSRPLVQLSLRGKTDDQLWFTLFHELGHVLLHPHNGLYLAVERDVLEREADTFAAESLIPTEYEDLLPRGRNKGAIKKLAEQLGVSPGIVLARAQRLTDDYAWGHDLKVHFEFEG